MPPQENEPHIIDAPQDTPDHSLPKIPPHIQAAEQAIKAIQPLPTGPQIQIVQRNFQGIIARLTAFPDGTLEEDGLIT